MFKPKEEPHQLICSYVLRKWFVSTAYRQSSAELNPCWYYETIIWRWNEKTRERGECLGNVMENRCPFKAVSDHSRICIMLINADGEDDEWIASQLTDLDR